MLKFTSDRQLVLVTASAIAVLFASACGFYFLQNNLGVTGGAIALPKLVWLAYALLFWFALPILIACDKRTPPILTRGFTGLFLLMIGRGVAELVMLYVLKNWSPIYGIAHDIVCMLTMSYFLTRAWIAGEVRATQLARSLFVHGIVTSIMFIPEIGFAWYMRTNFITQGSNAIYFVPDSAQHSVVLWFTTCIDIILTIYIPLFIRNWFYVPDRSHRL